MALTYSTLGSEDPAARIAPDFRLPGVDGREYSLADFGDARALVVVFMCNHCPYVVAVQGRINALAREYAPRGVRLVGINPNDATRYPDDSFGAMRERAREQGYVFPYLQDESQRVAREYGAVCTPDPMVYVREDGADGSRFRLGYHGRIDDSWKDEGAVKRRELAEALDAILAGREPSAEPVPTLGCSIKWK